MLRIFNTLSRRIEPFKPAEDKKVKMFTCGPSVYRRPHIGLVARYFGQNVPPAPEYCDIAPTPPDGKIDMKDIGLAARHFGEVYM